MPTARDPFAFETFPRGDLQLKIDRRQMFMTAVTAAKVREGRQRGGNAFTLSSLGNLADELLGLLSPTLVPECRIESANGFVWAHVSGQDPIKLFPSDSPAHAIVTRFDGRTMIEVLARELGADQGWEAAKAFAYVRGLFLHLTVLGVCLPG